MYQTTYTELNLKLKKEDEEVYKHALMQIILDNFFQKGFIATKINKATKKGTTVTFKSIKDYKTDKAKLFKIADDLGLRLEEKEKLNDPQAKM
jgi:hypothetical protein